MGFYGPSTQYIGHVVRASSLTDDIDLKGDHLQIKHIENRKDETNMQQTLFIYIYIFFFLIFKYFVFSCFF